MLFLASASDDSRGEDQPQYVQTHDGRRLVPTVAIDNVTAWPNLTLMPTGEIIASIFNKPSHGSMEGEIECWASTDEGVSWRKRGVPVRHKAESNRMNCAVGLSADGDLIAVISGWSNQEVAGQTPYSDSPFRAAILDPVVCRSSDQGRSWSVSESGMPPRCPDGGISIPYGDILTGGDGKLRLAAYSAGKAMVGLDKQLGDLSYIFHSDDDGRTWTRPIPLDTQRNRNETALLHLGNGEWLAAARSSDLGLYRSQDEARTWRFIAPATSARELPGHLLRLNDGRILLSYGDRTEHKGIEVRLSGDKGQSWGQPLRLCDFKGDGGYPSSVQLPTGEIVTAFYAQATQQHARYHMGVVRWNPDQVTTNP